MRLRVGVPAAAFAALIAAGPAAAAAPLSATVTATAEIGASTTTTTTEPTGTTTTTMFTPVDVTGGGDFEGGFPKNSFDSYTFELDEPRVLVAETTNGFGGCPGDTIVELRRPGAPPACTVFGDELLCVASDDDSGITVCSRLVHYLAEPGVYEIRVRAYNGNKLNRYFLHVDFVEIECGNDLVELTEQCDDGGVAPGDCCSPSCKYEAAGSPCSDGLHCNGADSCNAGGLCALHAGDPCPGPDGDADCTEACDEGSDSCTSADPNGSACDDGLFCNGADSCASGACSSHAGSPCPGADGDANCAESCSELSDACTASDPNGSPCDDELFCNGADSCSGGACTGHAGSPCPGADGDGDCTETCDEQANACTASDADGTPCDDGLFCNGADRCSGGACSVHDGDPCDGADGDGDCSEICDEAADACTASDPETSPCDDGVFCNGADQCSAGACSVHAGNPCDGPDGDVDCSETCDENAGACSGADPNGSSCEDGLACNGADSCAGGLCNEHEAPACPGVDGDGDCSESCSDSSGGCNGPDPAGSPCDDGIFCNGTDTCSNGSCSVHSGDPCAGADGDADCSESCNEAADSCDAPDPVSSPCTDDDPCTATAACNASGTCLGGAALDCDDDDDCTVDACIAGGTDCSHAPPLDCDDHDDCTADSCTGGGTGCAHAEPLDCDDGEECTIDTCTDGGTGCSNVPIDGCSLGLCGDVNGDGSVKASDALAVLRAAVGGPQCDGLVCLCDANGNGSIAASDALLVLRLAVGAPVTPSCTC